MFAGKKITAMEIFPHVHQISSGIADRHLHQYLFVGDNPILLDTGFSTTPGEVIIPYLQKMGLDAKRLSMAINTHADADHHGGNAALKGLAGDMLLACGDMDKGVIEDPDRLFATRYNHWMEPHGVGLANLPEAETWVRQMAGPRHRVDVTLRGGEQLAIDDKKVLRVLHVPGHSNGHLALYDPATKAVFVGDALHGSYCPSVDGKPSLPPAYFSVLAYLSTVQLFENLEIEWIYSAHWPLYGGPQVAEFLAECRKFVDRAEDQVKRAIERHPEGVTLRQCIDECGPALGNWPANNRWLLMYPLHGHLAHLEQQGVVKQVRDGGAVRWMAV
jgi:glyoxylase-like metal-dependent hydrolase (beta-lactamase superfamily II)